MGDARRKNEDRRMPDPLAIDPLAMIGYLSARQHLSDRLGETPASEAPRAARRSQVWRAAFRERLRATVERVEPPECDREVCVPSQ